MIAIVEALNGVSGAHGPALLASTAASAFAAGYLLSFSHEVANGQQRVPLLADVTCHLRRGVSLFLVELPGMLVSLPITVLLGAVLTIPYRLEVLSRSTVFGFIGLVFVVATTAASLPFVGPYVVEDRIAAAYRLKANVHNAWLNIELLAPPVVFVIVSSAATLALRPVLFWLTRAPIFRFTAEASRLDLLSMLGDRPVLAVFALFGAGVLSASIQVVAAQLLGKYARELTSLRVPV